MTDNIEEDLRRTKQKANDALTKYKETNKYSDFLLWCARDSVYMFHSRRQDHEMEIRFREMERTLSAIRERR